MNVLKPRSFFVNSYMVGLSIYLIYRNIVNVAQYQPDFLVYTP